MPQSPTKPKTTKQPPANPALLLTMTALDTTWRIFAPTLIGVIVGINLDHLWNIEPIMTISLLLVGVLIAAGLIYRQVKGVQR